MRLGRRALHRDRRFYTFTPDHRRLSVPRLYTAFTPDSRLHGPITRFAAARALRLICACAVLAPGQAWAVLPHHIAAAVGAMDDRSFASEQHEPTTHEHYIKVRVQGERM